MKTIVALLTIFLSLVFTNAALAQSKDSLGGIFNDVFGGIVSGRQGTEYQNWHGHLVQARGTTMIFRAEDGKTYAVDMSAINTETWHPMALGQPLTLAAKHGAGPQTLIAARIDPEQPDRAGHLREKRAFRTVHGRVERVEGSQLTVRMSDGTILPVDVAQMTGEAQFRANDWAVAFLEPGPANTVLWIDREDRTAEDRRGGFRGDILSGLSSENQKWHGHFVQAKGTTMIFRSDDGKTFAVDTSAITQTWHPIELGQALTLAARPGREPNTLVAARLQTDPPDRSTGKTPKKTFVSAQGTVEAMRGSEMRFRTTDGKILWADVSQMPGHAPIRANEQGTLTFEPGSRDRVVALWLDREEIQPSAVVNPGAVRGTGEYQRINGYVQSVGGATMSLRVADGRTLAIDTNQVDAQVWNTVRPGDLVSVVGKATARADQFVAEFIERETRR